MEQNSAVSSSGCFLEEQRVYRQLQGSCFAAGGTVQQRGFLEEACFQVLLSSFLAERTVLDLLKLRGMDVPQSSQYLWSEFQDWKDHVSCLLFHLSWMT